MRVERALLPAAELAACLARERLKSETQTYGRIVKLPVRTSASVGPQGKKDEQRRHRVQEPLEDLWSRGR